MLKFKDPEWGTSKVYMKSNWNGKKTFGWLVPWTHELLPSPYERFYWDLGFRDLCFHGLQASGLCLSYTGLGSAPYIHMEAPVESRIQLVCTAKGWFPEPQVYWEDITGEKLLAASEHLIQYENGLFYVEATLVVRNDSVENVSCLIHNPILNEKKSSVISSPGQSSVSRTSVFRLAGKTQRTVP